MGETQAQDRENLYRLLAACYREAPDAAFLGQLETSPLKEALAPAGVDLKEVLSELPAERRVETLAVEHTRLFAGPGKHISPHESVCLSGGGELIGSATHRVRQFMESADLFLPADSPYLPDHLSVELDCMAELCAREHLNRENARTLQGEFLEQHLGRWIPAFCKQVCEESELIFYRAFAELTRNFIADEKRALVAVNT